MSDRKHLHLRFNMKDSYDSKIYEAILGAGYRRGAAYIKDCIARCAHIPRACAPDACDGSPLDDLSARVAALEKKSASYNQDPDRSPEKAGNVDDDVLAFLDSV